MKYKNIPTWTLLVHSYLGNSRRYKTIFYYTLREVLCISIGKKNEHKLDLRSTQINKKNKRLLVTFGLWIFDQSELCRGFVLLCNCSVVSVKKWKLQKNTKKHKKNFVEDYPMNTQPISLQSDFMEIYGPRYTQNYYNHSHDWLVRWA